MIKNYIILFLLIASHFPLRGQGTFDIIPVTDGQQSELFDVYADSNFIYVIGDLMDTTPTTHGQLNFPWWGVFDYDGQLVTKKKLVHENFTNYISVHGSRLLRRHNGNFIYVPILYNESGNAECLVLEIESSTGNLINHSIIGNAFNPNEYIIPGWVTHDPHHQGNILLATNLKYGPIERMAILSIGRQLKVSQTILIDDNGRNNYSYYLENETDSTYLLIGDSRKRNDISESPDIKPFFMRVNSEGKILTFNLAQGIPDKSVGFFLPDNTSVSKDVDGNWIFSAHSYFPGWYSFPYIFSYDSEFKNMNWAINFSTDKNNTQQAHLLLGGDYDEMNGSYVAVGTNTYENDSYIIKTNDAGDSLWTRHYIPLNWQPEDVGFVGLIDIEATPYHSYVSVGKAVGRPDYLLKSWAILIDSFGCIIPGCQNTVSNEEIFSSGSNLFSIYPNPATTFVALLCNHNINADVNISVFDLSGRMIESVTISPTIGYQYLLNVIGWTSGIYFLRIESMDGRLIQEAQIIVN